MKKSLYCVYDRKAGTYNRIFDSINDETAVRDFNYAYSMPEMSFIQKDVELYYLGSIDYARGVIEATEKPQFLCVYGGELNG